MPKPHTPKNILCIHDLSGVGRCSLNEILPILSTMGMHVTALPTTLLSSHTGGLGQPAAQSCQEYGQAALAHYRDLELTFDCIYAGYLANIQQQQLVLDAFASWPNAFKVMDPVMGDHGKLYSGMESLVPGMAQLCRAADLTVPNLTEACLLLGQQYPQQDLTEADAAALAHQAAQAFGGEAVVTGLPLGKYIGCAGAALSDGFVQKHLCLPQSFPGTGDLFCSVLIGCLLRGNALSAAVDAAAGFVCGCISATPADADPRFGVWYETQLFRLIP